MRIALLVGLVACGKPDRSELAGLDLAEASLRVRDMVVDCESFDRALARLSAGGIAARPLAGLVDEAVEAARTRCTRTLDAIAGSGVAHALARARLLDAEPVRALAALANASNEPAIRFRKAELYDRERRTAEALAELEAGVALAVDEQALGMRRRLVISEHVRLARWADAARAIASAPVTERPALAYRAVADAPLVGLDALGAAAVEPELATVVADRLEHERGSPAALAVRERAAALAPNRAEHHDAFARSLAAAGRIDDAVAAWDRAAERAPAQPAYRLAPIRALTGSGQAVAARSRVRVLVESARAAADVDALLVASSAAAAIADRALAIELARDAQRQRPGDGRLAFTIAERLAEADDRAGAARAFTELLVCGAHARPWHRHEVAGRLVALASDAASARTVTAALDAKPACAAVRPDDLATYVDAARTKLAELR